MAEKPKPIPLKRTEKQIEAQAEAAAKAAEKAAQDAADLAAQQAAARTAQIANLLIAGMDFDTIGHQIGATGKEVEDMLSASSAQYIRSQPALRQWVRRWASGKYSALLDSVWDVAVDPKHRDQYAAQDRARPLVERIAKLHGAEAPTQAEVKIEQSPESVQKIVDRIAAAQGLGYDIDIFDDPDIVDADLVEQTEHAELEAGMNADAEQPGDGKVLGVMEPSVLTGQVPVRGEQNDTEEDEDDE